MTSKTKIGATLIGVGALLGTVGAYLTGEIELASALQAVIMEIGGVLTVWGIRDWPILNKKK